MITVDITIVYVYCTDLYTDTCCYCRSREETLKEKEETMHDHDVFVRSFDKFLKVCLLCSLLLCLFYKLLYCHILIIMTRTLIILHTANFKLF